MKQAAFFFSLILSMYMLGCQEDPCANQICTNGGTCIDGECDCPEGFIGPQCTIPLDPCITKACIESSTIRCEQGSGGEARCICEDGFEGDVCGDQWTDKFLGEFTASESCNGIGFNFDMNVLAGPEFKKFTLANFRNEATDSLTAKVVAEMVNPTVFDIPEQFMHFGAVTGFGSIADGIINITYEVIDGKDTLLCSATLEPR